MASDVPRICNSIERKEIVKYHSEKNITLKKYHSEKISR
jgi:hypothetical protein